MIDAVRDNQHYDNGMAKSIVPSTRTVVTCILWPGPACMLLAGYTVHGPYRPDCKPCTSLCENGCEPWLDTCCSYAAALLKRKIGRTSNFRAVSCLKALSLGSLSQLLFCIESVGEVRFRSEPTDLVSCAGAAI